MGMLCSENQVKCYRTREGSTLPSVTNGERLVPRITQ